MLHNNAIELYLEGTQEFKDGNYELALQFFDESLLLVKHGKTYQCKADTLEKLGYKDEAFKFIRLAYGESPTNDLIAKKFAEYLIYNNNINDAKEILNKILLRNPSYMPAQHILNNL